MEQTDTMYPFRRFAAAVIAVVIALPSVGLAQVATTPVGAAGEVSIRFAGDELKTYRGVLVRMEYWVALPDQWALTEDAVLEISFSHTPLLIERLSSLTAEINDTAINSRMLNIQTARGGKVSWTVRPEYLKLGEMNKIVLIAKLRSDLELCDDVHSPALWLTIAGAQTGLKLKYRQKPVELDISRFPTSYLRPELGFRMGDVDDDVHSIIVTPVERTPEILRGIAVVGARLGVGSQQRGGRILVRAVGAVDGDVEQELAGRNLIAIGPADFIRRLGVDAPSLLDAAAQPGRGWLIEAANPWNPGRRILAVTGADDAELGKAVSALELPHLAEQWRPVGQDPPRRSVSFATAPTPPSAAPASTSTTTATMSLIDLGSSDMTVRGKFHHFLSVAFPNPYVGRLQSPAFVRFILSHSELLRPQTSSMLVRMNGQPVRSVRLTPSTSQRLEVDVIIPTELLGERVILADIEFFLDIGDSDCHYAFPEMAWATVHNESFIAYSLSDSPTTSLRSYPWVVAKGRHMGAVVFVVAEDASDEELGAVANMAAFLGESLPRHLDTRARPAAPRVAPRVRTASSLTDEDQRSADLIVVGDYDLVRSNSQIQASVPDVLLADDGGDFEDQGGWIHLTWSPWNPARNLLVVSGAGGAQAVANTARVLWVHKEVDKLSGSTVLVGANGSTQVLTPAPGEQVRPSGDPGRVLVPRVPGGGKSALRLLSATEQGADGGGPGVDTAPISAPAAPSKKHQVAYLVFVILGLLLVVLVVVRIRDAMRQA